MPRFCTPLLTGLVLLATALPTMAADPPAGTWRATFAVQTGKGQQVVNLLMMFSESEGKRRALSGLGAGD